MTRLSRPMSGRTKRRRLAGAVIAVSALLVGGVVVGEAASAQEADVAFANDIRVPVGAECPADTAHVGTITSGTQDGSFDGMWCRPDRYRPVESAAECAGTSGTWTSDPHGVCIGGADHPEVFGHCPAPTTFSFPLSGEAMCVQQVLTNAPSSGAPQYATYTVVLFGYPCPAQTSFGASHGSIATLCLTPGFAPIRDAATCEAARAARPDSATSWTGEPYNVCGFVFDGLRHGNCLPLLLQAGADECALPVLVETRAVPRPAQRACITSDVVQNHPDARSLGLGDRFVDAPGTPYVVTSGPLACEFNCIDGFDANCDGRIGDFCPAELDDKTAAGAQACLQALEAMS